MKLNKTHIKDILQLLKEYNPYVNEIVLMEMLCDKSCNMKIYGKYCEGTLVSMMCATYLNVFPHKDSPTGRIVRVSGAYTDERFRRNGYARELLREIEKDVIEEFDCDYICCDSSVDELYISEGYVESSESRLRKSIDKEKDI